MFCYKRKTSFIDYYINGIKSRSIGVVKQKLNDGRLEMVVELSGPAEWKNSICKVSIGDGRGEEKIGEMHICNGRGSSAFEIELKKLNANCDKKLFLAFGNDCYGVADLLELQEVDRRDEVNIEKIVSTESASDIENEGAEEETEENLIVAGVEDKEDITDYAEDHEAELRAECLEVQPDKWEVIKKKYPILYPFKGQGPYVSIKPVDLQLLSPRYHSLNQNSYLMHGFYQYRHMILGEYTQEKGTFFYVGVPGEFVKKEQTSAAMFGFEGYEHSGDLGYYLYRVEL